MKLPYTLLILICLLWLPFSILSAQPLTPEEQKIITYVEGHTEEAVDLLERVVNINSGTMNHAGVKAVGDIFAQKLSDIGLETEWINLPDSVNRAGHLFAKRTGTQGKRLLLIGHLDTVFEEDSPFQNFTKQGSRAKGPGAADMKGGDVVILYALKALHAIGALDGTTITVALTGDEEKPGLPLEVSRGHLIEAGQQSDIALGFEGGSKGFAVIARRSSSEWKLTVAGKQAHSSRIFSKEVGSGAIFEAARILNAFHEKVKGEKYLTFNPGIILGGTGVQYEEEQTRGNAYGKTNVVAKKVVVEGGLRTISEAQAQSAMEKMRAVVENGNLPGTRAKITFTEGYPAMSPREENYTLLEQFGQVSQDLGYEAIAAYDPGARGAADISFVPFIAGMDGLGVYGSGAHAPGEEVDLASMPVAIKRAAILIYRLSR